MSQKLEECSICLESLQKDDYSILGNCLHKFHESCIKEWFMSNKSCICPICNIENPDRIHLIPQTKQLGKPLLTPDKKVTNRKLDCCIIN
jgi:hypothetical protein